MLIAPYILAHHILGLTKSVFICSIIWENMENRDLPVHISLEAAKVTLGDMFYLRNNWEQES